MLDMNLEATLSYFVGQEKQSGGLLLEAICRSKKKNYDMLIYGNSLYLPAVNTKARIKWGRELIRELFGFLKVFRAHSLRANEPIL
jgi:hypothetical protein